jgi:ABC-2 type transport system ATP-binding protein
MQALKVDALSKSFGRSQAVRNVSFSVATGETVAFLGPNGAGKSTTLRMIAGFLEPDSGDALINSVSILSDRTKAQLALGYLAEGAPLYFDLSVRDFLGFLARTHGLNRAAAKDAIARVAEDAAIADVISRPIGHCRKAIAAASRSPAPSSMIRPCLSLMNPPTASTRTRRSRCARSSPAWRGRKRS